MSSLLFMEVLFKFFIYVTIAGVVLGLLEYSEKKVIHNNKRKIRSIKSRTSQDNVIIFSFVMVLIFIVATVIERMIDLLWRWIWY